MTEIRSTARMEDAAFVRVVANFRVIRRVECSIASIHKFSVGNLTNNSSQPLQICFAFLRNLVIKLFATHMVIHRYTSGHNSN